MLSFDRAHADLDDGRSLARPPSPPSGPILYTVARPCPAGLCPAARPGAACACSRVDADVEVDELTEEERGRFAREGTREQRAEVLGWWMGEVA